LPSGSLSAQAEVEPGLRFCADCIAGLEELVKKYEGKLDRGGGLMRKAGFAFSRKQFDKHIRRLERSKGYLLFAQTVLIRYVDLPYVTRSGNGYSLNQLCASLKTSRNQGVHNPITNTSWSTCILNNY
jgi:hypothetical protein